MGNAAGELHHVEAALDVAAGIGQHLAVLGREPLRQLLGARLDQAAELEQHPGATLRIERRPRALGAGRRGDRGIHHPGVAEADPALDLAGVGIEDVAPARRRPRQSRSVDEMGDVVHGGWRPFLA